MEPDRLHGGLPFFVRIVLLYLVLFPDMCYTEGALKQQFHSVIGKDVFS